MRRSRILHWCRSQTTTLNSITDITQPLIFTSLYLVYKYIAPRSFRVDLRDLSTSHYVLADLHSSEQPFPATLNSMPSNSIMPHSPMSPVELESPWPETSDSGRTTWKAREDSITQRKYEMDPEIAEAMEAQRSQMNERQRIQDILECRPRRWENGFWREMWSFVIVKDNKQRYSNRTPGTIIA